jgi:hypothetical protein
MKQKIYIIGVVTVVTVFTGAIFKVNHYPGAGVLLIAGLVSLVFLSMLFKLMHWPYAGVLLTITLYLFCFCWC